MSFVPFNKEALFVQTQRNLPHRTQKGCTYFVTWRLADSLPSEIIERWQKERVKFMVTHPLPWDAQIQLEYDMAFPGRLEEWADNGYGACVLKQPKVQDIIANALHYFEGSRYQLGAFVVMPNHLHILVTPFDGHTLRGILQSWKSFTAKAINREIDKKGVLWMSESFDHAVRSQSHLEYFKRYIRENPAKAQLRAGDYLIWERTEEGTLAE